MLPSITKKARPISDHIDVAVWMLRGSRCCWWNGCDRRLPRRWLIFCEKFHGVFYKTVDDNDGGTCQSEEEDGIKYMHEG